MVDASFLKFMDHKHKFWKRQVKVENQREQSGVTTKELEDLDKIFGVNPKVVKPIKPVENDE